MKTKTEFSKTAHDRANLAAARIILAAPGKYPPGSGLHQWARLITERLTPQGDSR